MAGTVVADTWQNGDGTENYKCRAWVNFNGTYTVAIRASGNVSSITDNGVGDYTVNFTTPMPDANYSIAGCGNEQAGGNYALATTMCPYSTATYLSTSCRVFASNLDSNGAVDGVIQTFMAFR